MAQVSICLFNKDGTEKPIESIISEASRATYQDTLIINGKEPTTHIRFHEILSRIGDNKPKDILLVTNGRSFKTREDVSYLSNIKGLNIFVTPFEEELFLSGDAAGFNLAYSDSLQGMTMLLAYNLRVAAMIPILRENNYHLLDMIMGLDAIGMKNMILHFAPPNPGAAIPRYSDLHQGVLNAIDSVNFIVHIEGIPPCMLGRESEHSSRFFTVYDNLKRQTPVCSECKLRNDCPGIYEKYLEQNGAGELAPFNDNILNRLAGHNKDLSKAQAAANDISKTVSEHSDKPCLKLSSDELIAAISAIESQGKLWETIENLGYPIPIVIEIIEELKERGLAEISGDKISLNATLAAAPEEFRSFDSWRLPSDPQYCQLRVRSTDLAERAKYVVNQCGAGGRIAVLGDDDFFSLTLAASGHFSEVALFEIDEKISSRIAEIAKREKLPLAVACHDLRKPLPARFLRMYDAFYTDSPYSLKGFELFVSRGIQLLSPGGKKHGFASFSCEIPVMEDLELPVQKAITDMGLFIERKTLPAANVIPAELKARFPTYESLKKALDDAPANLSEQERWYLACLGRKETLFHFLATERTKPMISGECTDEIYYEEEPLEFYLKNMRWKERHTPENQPAP